MTLLARLDKLLSYDTVKVVRIENWILGALHYLFIIVIFLYVFGWSIVWKNGYQTTSPVVGTVSVKVKGSGIQQQINNTVWDAIDIVNPPLEDSAVFITTNAVVTPRQTRGLWNSNVSCDYCTRGNFTEYGVATGVCLDNNTTCQIDGWGPFETKPANLSTTVLTGIPSMTLFIRAGALFPSFDERRDNIGDQFNPNNFWTVSELLEKIDSTYANVSAQGCIVVVSIEWNCNFDPWAGECKPEFAFYRIDDTTQTFSVGFNYRYAHYYQVNDIPTRDLFKAYGIRVAFITGGTGRRLSIVPLVINIGSAFGLLSFSTIVVDFLIVHLLPTKKRYIKRKISVISREVYSSHDQEKPILGSESVNSSSDYQSLEPAF